MQTKTMLLFLAGALALAFAPQATAAFEKPAPDAVEAGAAASPVSQAPAGEQAGQPSEQAREVERLCKSMGRRGGHPTTRQKRAFRRPCHGLAALPVSMSEIDLVHQQMLIEAIDDPGY